MIKNEGLFSTNKMVAWKAKMSNLMQENFTNSHFPDIVVLVVKV